MRPFLSILLRSFPLLVLFFCPAGMNAQVKVYGVTAGGGDSSAGVIFSVMSDGSNYQVLYSFKGNESAGAPSQDGADPLGSLTMGFNTKLYGLTSGGGRIGGGTLYTYDTATHVYGRLFDLDTATGYNPSGGMTFFNNKFYGLGVVGGANNYGTIFCYDPAAGTLTDVYDMTAADGINPFGNITVSKNLLYFTTNTGGANNGGTLDVFDPVAGTLTDLYDFAHGVGPWSSLAVQNNVLYGIETFGGYDQLGTIYSFNLDSNIYKDLFDYDIFYNGAYPYGITSYNGLLYITTANGGKNQQGGTIGYLNPAIDGYLQFYSFNTQYDPSAGLYPYATPLITPSGLLLGTTEYGGTADSGVIYSYDLNTSTYTKLVDLGGSKGASPLTGGLFLPGAGVALSLGVVQFGGQLTDAGRVLNWSASQAAPGEWFQLQRSTDEQNFTAIDSVAASLASANGHYTYTDAVPLPGVSGVYYRLKMTGAGQAGSYSNIVAIGLPGGGDSLRLINTVVNGTALLQYTSVMQGSLLVRVVSLSGQVMQQQELAFSAGLNNYSLDMSALPKGMYVLQAGGASIKFVRL